MSVTSLYNGQLFIFKIQENYNKQLLCCLLEKFIPVTLKLFPVKLSYIEKNISEKTHETKLEQCEIWSAQ